MKGIVVISVDIENPEDWSEIVDAMHLSDVPHVDGDVRIAIGEARDRVMEVLDSTS